MGASCSSPQAATPSQNVNLEDGLRDHRQSLDFDELYDDDGTKVIGRSGTTVVTRATRRSDGVSVAVKVIPRGELSADPSATERIVRECKLHKRLRHRNIVQLFDVFVEPERIRFVMEVCAGGDLHDGVRRFGGRVPDAQARSIMRQTLAAVAYLHANGVIHRDIKVENVLLTNNTSQPGVKLADFGYSKELSDLVARAARSGSADGRPGMRKKDSVLGTPEYAAPEILNEEKYDTPVDIYACGVAAFLLLTGELPYERTRRTSTIALVRRKSRGVLETALAHPQLALHASDDARDALRQMLDPSPAARPSATALLGHAWLRAAPGAEGADDDATNVTLSVASLETACAAAAQHPSLDSVDSRDSDAAAAPNSAAAPKQPSVSDYNRWSRAAAPKPTRRPSQVALSEIEEVAQSSAPPPALSPLELARAGPMSTPPRPSPDDERASAVADDDAAEPAAGSEHKQYVDRSGNSFALSVLPDDGSADAIVVLGLETKSEAEQLEEHRRICDAVYNSDDDDDNGATASLLCSSDVPRAPGEVALPPADEQPSEQPQPPEPQPVADGWTIDGSDHEHHFYVCSPPELADFDQKIAPVDEDGEFV